jgi:magnesium-transporting ATPase (P-type)
MFAVGVFSNPWIIVGVAAMIAAQLLFTYAPIMNRLFHTAPISGQAWLHILAVAVAAYAVVGVEKWLRCRRARAREKGKLAGNPVTSNHGRSL